MSPPAWCPPAPWRVRASEGPRAMTADVNQDRRVTVPTLGSTHTRFVDWSRLFWALLSPVHERLGYRVLAPDRIQGDAVSSAFILHGPVQDHVSPLIARPRPSSSRPSSLAPSSPPSRPLRAASGGGLRPALTAAARGASAGSWSGRRNGSRSNKETDKEGSKEGSKQERKQARKQEEFAAMPTS